MRKLYKLGDHLSIKERERFGIKTFKESYSIGWAERDGILIRAQMTGVVRPPKKGEWYISGAKPVAYKAPNDLTQKHVLAELVRVKRETKVTYSYSMA